MIRTTKILYSSHQILQKINKTVQRCKISIKKSYQLQKKEQKQEADLLKMWLNNLKNAKY